LLVCPLERLEAYLRDRAKDTVQDPLLQLKALQVDAVLADPVVIE